MDPKTETHSSTQATTVIKVKISILLQLLLTPAVGTMAYRVTNNAEVDHPNLKRRPRTNQ
jgi:hypothetical protein